MIRRQVAARYETASWRRRRRGRNSSATAVRTAATTTRMTAATTHLERPWQWLTGSSRVSAQIMTDAFSLPYRVASSDRKSRHCRRVSYIATCDSLSEVLLDQAAQRG